MSYVPRPSYEQTNSSSSVFSGDSEDHDTVSSEQDALDMSR
jgi:hypothetical protein